MFWICSSRLFGWLELGLRKAAYVPLSWRIRSRRSSRELDFEKNDFFFFFEIRFLFFFFFYLFFFFFEKTKKQISIFFFLNKMWSFEQPFWKIIVFKNQTNLFDYEGSRSLNSCNQNLLLSFEHRQIKSPKAIKKWSVIIFMNHIVGCKQGECSKFEISFESFEDLRIWEILSSDISFCGIWQF